MNRSATPDDGHTAAEGPAHSGRTRALVSLAVACVTSGALVVTAAIAALPEPDGRDAEATVGNLEQRFEAAAATAAAEAAGTASGADAVDESLPHTHPGEDAAALVEAVDGTVPDDGHDHVHNDPTTKNAVSRSGEAASTKDPTTPAQPSASAATTWTSSTARSARSPAAEVSGVASGSRTVTSSIASTATGGRGSSGVTAPSWHHAPLVTPDRATPLAAPRHRPLTIPPTPRLSDARGSEHGEHLTAVGT